MLLDELVDCAKMATLQGYDCVLVLQNASLYLVEVLLLAREGVICHFLVLLDHLDALLDKEKVGTVTRNLVSIEASRLLA